MSTFVFPGQGSQKKGMGAAIFGQFPELVRQADDILGYSIVRLCQEDPENQLRNTSYTQPALYVVNALSWLDKTRHLTTMPAYVAGHSLGEFNALFAAGAFDFATGLKIVQKRGELMGQVKNGAMAAVIGLNENQIEEVLRCKELADTHIDIANYNSPTQTVISGLSHEIGLAEEAFKNAGATFIPLPVSAAFHSRYMRAAQDEFKQFLDGIDFGKLTTPVIANLTARPYLDDEIKENLVKHFTHPVRWTDSIRYLMEQGEAEFEEVGPGNVLSKFVAQIRSETLPLSPKKTAAAIANRFSAESIGSKEFKEEYKLKYAYLAGGMYRGISSSELVIKLGNAGLMGYFGTGGLSLRQVDEAIQRIQGELGDSKPYGMNLICNLKQPEKEQALVALFLQRGVRNIEASAYMQITPSLVWYRLQGLHADNNGEVCCTNKIMAKISRPEVAQEFLAPISEGIVATLLREGKISEQQAQWSQAVPLVDDLCVEADSAGHTDRGVALVLVPAIIRLRDQLAKKYVYTKKIRVGAAGGIGSPEAAAAAFMLGADFILTGSINQCTVEAGCSPTVKDFLQEMEIQDTDFAPSGELFELGAKVQVLKRSSFFPARASRLYDLYRLHGSLDEIDAKSREHIEQKYFGCSFEEAYRETKDYFLKENPQEIESAEKNAKHKMALVFKWYLALGSRLAMDGNIEKKINFQIHTGPAMGAFNQWVQGTPLESWRNRHVDEIAVQLMRATAEHLTDRFSTL